MKKGQRKLTVRGHQKSHPLKKAIISLPHQDGFKSRKGTTIEQGDSDSEDIICIVTFNLLVDPSVVESKMVLGLPYVTAITDLFKTYQTSLSPLVKCFTDSFKAVLLLWTNLFLSCFLVCSLQPCWVLWQVWYLIVSIPNLCLLTYFVDE